MHELSLASVVFDKIEQLREELGFRTVQKVVVEIGSFSNVVPESFHQAFEVLKVGTCASLAELVTEEKRGKLSCDSCGAEYFPEIPVALCPECGRLTGRVVQGRELIMKSLEVDDEDTSG